MIESGTQLERGNILVTADDTQPARIYEDPSCLHIEGFKGYQAWTVPIAVAVQVDEVSPDQELIKVYGWADDNFREGYIRREEYRLWV